MEGYQNLIIGIEVPSEWPVREIRTEILNIVRNAIMHHLSGQQVILTIKNISTRLIQNDSGIGYIFRRIQEIPDDSYKIDLILPSDILLISDAERISIPVEAENLKFHSLDLQTVQKVLGRKEIMIAVPDLCKILEMRGITGDLIHKAIFKTTYRNIQIIQISTSLYQFTLNADPKICVQRVAENEWNVLCFNQIPAPQWCFWEQLDTWTRFCIIATSFLLLMYCLFQML